jgi:hypothetical protein
MSITATQTSTYTIADVRKVVENFAADFSMMSVATGLRSRDDVTRTVSDLRAFSEDGHLVEVKLILKDASGNKLRGASYKVSQSAVGWTSDRPGNNLWPRTPGGVLWVIATLGSEWNSMSPAQKQAYKTRRGFNYDWDPTTEDTSFGRLAANYGQRYASNAYGWQRINYN